VSRSRSAEPGRVGGGAWWRGAGPDGLRPPGGPPGWRSAARWLVGAWLLLLALQALGPLDIAPLQRLDRWLYDLQLRQLAPHQVDPRIVLVDIDEQALAEHGRWPWRRAVLADLLERIAGREGARLVGLDLVLAEPDRSSGLAALEALATGALRDEPGFQAALRQLRPQLDDDGRLTDVLRRHPVVLGFHLSNEAGAARSGALPPPLAASGALGAAGAGLLQWSGHGGNLPRLQDAAQLGAGHLNALIDADGLVRRLPLLVQHDGGVHGTLALVMARALLAGPADGTPGAAPTLSASGTPLHALQLRGAAGRLQVPVDAQAVALVPYAAVGTAFPRLSAADVLAGRLPPGALRGKIVLVGVSAPGLIDQRATPVDEALLGTLVHAHLLSGLLGGQVRAVPAAAPLVEAATLLALGALLVWALPRLALWRGALLCGVLMLALAGAHAAAWQQAALVLPLASGLLLPPLLLALYLLLAFRQATGARRQLAGLFGQYVPPELVAEMSHAPARYSMRSRSAELTVLFADVPGFSGLAERMPPAELGAMMNLLFSHLTDVVRAHRGTLDKYIGDAVMAFWGAPLDDPDHACHAVEAALAMQARLPALHAELAAHGWPPLALNIGVNTGSMVVGDMGSRHRRAYTVMGDAVNLAARLQSLCSHHGLGLVVGDATRRALGDTLCLALGRVGVRGRDAPVQVWHPLPWRAGEQPAADRIARDWQRLRAAAESGRRAEAEALLDQLQDEPAVAALCRWQRHQLHTGASGQGADGPRAAA